MCELSRRVFLSIIISVLIACVPLVIFSARTIAFELLRSEENSAKTILDNICAMLKANYQNQTDTHKQWLKDIVKLAEVYLQALPEKPPESLKKLNNFLYGVNNDDYIWIVNFQGTIVWHPDKKLIGQPNEKTDEKQGNLYLTERITKIKEITQNIVNRIGPRQDGDGFLSYTWPRLTKEEDINKLAYPNGDSFLSYASPRLTKEEDINKLAYFKSYPKWKIIIVSGVYIPDIVEEVKRLGTEFNELKLGDNGYFGIMTKDKNMIVHPQQAMLGDFSKRIDKSTGKPIAEELINAANKRQALSYIWDKPSDPGNEIYKKIAWVKYIEELGFYVIATIYEEDFAKKANTLECTMIAVSVVALIASIVIGYWQTRSVVQKWERLQKQRIEIAANVYHTLKSHLFIWTSQALTGNISSEEANFLHDSINKIISLNFAIINKPQNYNLVQIPLWPFIEEMTKRFSGLLVSITTMNNPAAGALADQAKLAIGKMKRLAPKFYLLENKCTSNATILAPAGLLDSIFFELLLNSYRWKCSDDLLPQIVLEEKESCWFLSIINSIDKNEVVKEKAGGGLELINLLFKCFLLRWSFNYGILEKQEERFFQSILKFPKENKNS